MGDEWRHGYPGAHMDLWTDEWSGGVNRDKN